MSSSTFNFERAVPPVRWTLIAGFAALLLLIGGVGWELHCRRLGYAPTVNDSMELWAARRGAVAPDSVVIIGDSRAWFDLDLDELEKGLGKRPVQLALSGSTVFPVLKNLCEDEQFHGTIICSVLPVLYFVPAGPPLKRSQDAVDHYLRQPLSERLDLPLAMFLEQRLAFMNMQELTLEEMLKGLPIPDRAAVAHGPKLPPYFNAMDPERHAWMIERCVQPGPLQDLVRRTWPPLFTPPPPPPGVTQEEAMRQFGIAFEQRLKDSVSAVDRLRRRGGKIVFVRFPCSGPLKELEAKLTPRERTWDVLLQATQVPGVYFEDHAELSGFDCPEYSHLKPDDVAEFSRRLVPYLKANLQ